MTPSCPLLGGFAIGGQVVLLWQHSANAKCQQVLVLAVCLVCISSESCVVDILDVALTLLVACQEWRHLPRKKHSRSDMAQCMMNVKYWPVIQQLSDVYATARMHVCVSR